jgi:hypothetical protein
VPIFGRCWGSDERETTPKEHCRQGEIARILVTFGLVRRIAGRD